MAVMRKKYLEVSIKKVPQFQLPYWEIDSGKDGPCFMINAAQHGNEIMGCEVLRRFCPVASEKLERGRILMLPFINPLALKKRRTNIDSLPCKPKTGSKDDMNLAWPGRMEGTEIEQLVFTINKNLLRDVTHNIDMHCWSRINVTCAWPQESKKIMDFARAAALPGMKISSMESASGPITLARFMNSTGRIAFDMEFSGQYLLSEKEISRGLRMLSNCSKYLGIFPGEMEGMEEPVICMNEMIEVKASIDGLFVENGLKPGDYVEKGAMLGTLFSDSTLENEEVRAPEEGFLGSYGCRRRLSDVDLAAMHPYASKGDILAGICSQFTVENETSFAMLQNQKGF